MISTEFEVRRFNDGEEYIQIIQKASKNKTGNRWTDSILQPIFLLCDAF